MKDIEELKRSIGIELETEEVKVYTDVPSKIIAEYIESRGEQSKQQQK
jgi:hypothetical protein